MRLYNCDQNTLLLNINLLIKKKIKDKYMISKKIINKFIDFI